MCGIAGIHAYHYAAPAVDRDELRSIGERMRRRGPDGAGEWFSGDERLGLAHRRLKIIDLSDAGAQPMVSPCGRYRISYNGEIYNYRELRAGLEARGYRFRSQSDTEVLLALFAEHGTAMFPKLRGMYAFGLWDDQERKLLLARDPFGIKPLYYADDGWTCRFASQVKALRAGGRISNDPEPAGQAGFLLFGSVPEPHTWWLEIRALPAGHFLIVDELGAGTPEPHFELESLFGSGAAGGDPRAGLREALLESVRHHLVADVPVGAFLSSGVDSALLVSLVRELSTGPLRTVTIGFEEFRDTELDECPLAAEIAARYDTEHHRKMISRAEFERDLPAILDAMDQPSIDGINTWMVAKATAEAGLKVALSGLGGDELSGGYPSFRDLPRWRRRLGWSRWIPGLGALSRRLMVPLLPALGVHPKAAGMLEYGATDAGRYLLKRGLYMPWELPALLGPETARAGLERLKPLPLIDASGAREQRGDFHRVAVMELGCYMKNQLLRDTDWAAMAHSIEVRVPLVDVPLQRACHRLFEHGPSKRDLASAASPALPQEVLGRGKTGFSTPLSQWLEPPRREDRPEHWSRRWAHELGVQCAFSH